MIRFYSVPACLSVRGVISFTLPRMASRILMRMGLASEWSQEVFIALLALGMGFGVMPLLIYYAGSATLGRYEGANPARVYDAVYQGLKMGSGASLIVAFGPYGLYLAFRALRLWWRASARLA